MAVLITSGASPLGLAVAQALRDKAIPFELLDDMDGVDLSKLEGKPYTSGRYFHQPTVRKVCHTYNIDTVIHLDLGTPDRESPFDSLKLVLESYDCGVDNFIYVSERGNDNTLVHLAISMRFPGWTLLRYDPANPLPVADVLDATCHLMGLQ